MAILNVTPDSFSDGGRHLQLDDTVAAALQFAKEGADIIDVGGESTRPGAEEINAADEIQRVVPVIQKLAAKIDKPISIDTCKPAVAERSLQAGAKIINDISGLRDPEMLDLCTSSDCGIVVMHMQGTPKTMQKSPSYTDVITEVKAFFEERFRTLTAAGIAPERIVFDPGIGFGKELSHNLTLLAEVEKYRVADRPVLMGLSRKSLIGSLLGNLEMPRRESPTQALTALTRRNGASIHRTHQVKEIVETLQMTDAVILR